MCNSRLTSNADSSAPCHQADNQAQVTIVDSYDQLINKTVQRECKYSLALGSTLLVAVIGKHCGTLVQTGEPFFEDAVSFVLPKGSPYTLEMSNATLQLKAEGELKSFLEYLRTQEKCPLKSSPTLTFRKLRIFFFVAFAVCFVVFVEMVVDPQKVDSGSAERNAESDAEGKGDGDQSEAGSSTHELTSTPSNSFHSTPEENA